MLAMLGLLREKTSGYKIDSAQAGNHFRPRDSRLPDCPGYGNAVSGDAPRPIA
jgi:hypothetical protein